MEQGATVRMVPGIVQLLHGGCGSCFSSFDVTVSTSVRKSMSSHVLSSLSRVETESSEYTAEVN